MDTLPATRARSNLYTLMDRVAEYHEPVLITGKRHHAVLIGAEDWQDIQETLYLMSIPGMVESLHQARHQPVDTCTEDLSWTGA